jgi:putative transposase
VPHRARVQPRALSPAERAAVLAALHAERFADLAPAEVWAILLDEGTYLGSLSTFRRLLRAAGETRERRAQATHPARAASHFLDQRARTESVRYSVNATRRRLIQVDRFRVRAFRIRQQRGARCR